MNPEKENTQLETPETEEMMKMLLNDSQNSDVEAPIFIYDTLEFDDDVIQAIVKTKEFIEGYSIGAKYAGIYATMVNMGCDLRVVQEIVTNEQVLEHNRKLQKIVNEGSIQTAKESSLVIDKNSI